MDLLIDTLSESRRLFPVERVKELISELKSDEIELTVNGTAYVSEDE